MQSFNLFFLRQPIYNMFNSIFEYMHVTTPFENIMTSFIVDFNWLYTIRSHHISRKRVVSKFYYTKFMTLGGTKGGTKFSSYWRGDKRAILKFSNLPLHNQKRQRVNHRLYSLHIWKSRHENYQRHVWPTSLIERHEIGWQYLIISVHIQPLIVSFCHQI